MNQYDKQTQQNDILIAKFLGIYRAIRNPTTGEWEEPTYSFSFSWDSLMMAVEKINTMDNYAYSVNIKHHYTDIVDNNGGEIITEDGYNTIDGVYKAVISFIKWWNTTK